MKCHWCRQPKNGRLPGTTFFVQCVTPSLTSGIAALIRLFVLVEVLGLQVLRLFPTPTRKDIVSMDAGVNLPTTTPGRQCDPWSSGINGCGRFFGSFLLISVACLCHHAVVQRTHFGLCTLNLRCIHMDSWRLPSRCWWRFYSSAASFTSQTLAANQSILGISWILRPQKWV